MRYLVTVLFAWVLIATISIIHSDLRITNLERQLLRIEREYNAVIEYNQQLERINNQNVRLLTEGGWNAVVGIDTID